MTSSKTLIGKNGYLFLCNDSCNEIDRHIKNESVILDKDLKRYDPYFNKFFITVFPNKSFVCRSNLPDGYDLNYRPDLMVYKEKFGNGLLDGYEVIGDNSEHFYKTDTHMNVNGIVQIYYEFVKRINKKFGFNIKEKQFNIKSKNLKNLMEIYAYGDLTWPFNLGDQTLVDISDTYYYSDDIFNIYVNCIIKKEFEIQFFKIENDKINDFTDSLLGQNFGWSIVSDYIIYKKNENKPNHKVIIFYDSFLVSTLYIYLELFYEVYMVKNVFDKDVIEKINPDFIFEFRVERFLY
jgi:hypothetical protein